MVWLNVILLIAQIDVELVGVAVYLKAEELRNFLVDHHPLIGIMYVKVLGSWSAGDASIVAHFNSSDCSVALIVGGMTWDWIVGGLGGLVSMRRIDIDRRANGSDNERICGLYGRLSLIPLTVRRSQY